MGKCLWYHGDLEAEWISYTTSLKLSFIFPKENESDTISWAKNIKYGSYTVKFGNLALVEESTEGVIKWWWREIWKWKSLEKIKVMFWLSMEQKIITWDFLWKRGWNGSSRCSLCNLNYESIVHLFFQCAYAK
jgi:hypothetical protein